MQTCRTLADAMMHATSLFATEGSNDVLNQVLKQVEAIKTPNQYLSVFHLLGSAVRNGAGRGKIPCQPTTIAKSNGRPRGAAPLTKGRRPKALLSQTKRSHNLSQNIDANQANAKNHGTGH